MYKYCGRTGEGFGRCGGAKMSIDPDPYARKRNMTDNDAMLMEEEGQKKKKTHS